MNRRMLILWILVVAIEVNCDLSQQKIAHNPIKTALGELAEINLIKEIQINDQIITSEPGQVLLLLKFEGKTEIPYQSAGNRDDYYVLIDSTDNASNKFLPIFVGAYDSTQKLSDQFDWKMNGTMTVRNSRTVFTGTIELTRPEVVVVYKIALNYHQLYLLENGKKLCLH